MILHRYRWSLIAVHDISLVCITHNLNITKGPEGIRKWYSWQIQHRPNRRAISVWSKEAIGKLSYMVVGYVTLGNFLQLAMLFFAMLSSTWVDIVLIFWLQSFECGSHSTLTAATMMLRKCIIIENKVIKFWNALALHYIIYRNHSFTAGKTRLLAFDCDHLYEIWRKIEQIQNKWKYCSRCPRKFGPPKIWSPRAKFPRKYGPPGGHIS